MFNLFVTSSQATTVFDVVTLTDWQSSPPQKYWAVARTHSLAFYKADTTDFDHADCDHVTDDHATLHDHVELHDHVSSPAAALPEYSGVASRRHPPHFSVNIHADLQRMVKWAPPPEDEKDHPVECLLVLTESSMLYLVQPEYASRRLQFISKVVLSVGVPTTTVL